MGVVTGGALQVVSTGTGGFSPLDLTGLVAWYDASDLDTITVASGSKVSQWDDKGPDGHHAAQGTADFQPDTGLYSINGLNVLYFFIGKTLATASFTKSQPLTVFAVAQSIGYRIYGALYDGGGSGTRMILGCYTDAGNVDWRMYAGSWVDTTRPFPVGGTPSLTTAVFNGASSEFRENGAQYGGSLNPGSAGITAGLLISSGSSNASYYGYYAEIVAYNAVLGTTDREAVESYLMSKWGI